MCHLHKGPIQLRSGGELHCLVRIFIDNPEDIFSTERKPTMCFSSRHFLYSWHCHLPEMKLSGYFDMRITFQRRLRMTLWISELFSFLPKFLLFHVRVWKMDIFHTRRLSTLNGTCVATLLGLVFNNLTV